MLTKLKTFFKKLRPYKPYLELYFSLGFFRIQTAVMREAIERYEYTYIALEWKLFKWSGRFRLYKPGTDL